jgi:hypothetical protein
MRGWLLVRVIIAVLVVVAAWLLSIIPVLPSAWQPRAPLVALVIILLLYIGAEYVHGVASRKETQAYRSHIRDLQEFARLAANIVGRRYQQNITERIDLEQPLGRSFRNHFGKIAAMIDEWNEVAGHYHSTSQRFLEATYAERDRLALGGSSGFPSILQGIVNGGVNPSDLVWEVQTNQIIAGLGSFWQVGPLPKSEGATETLLLNLWDSCIAIRDRPEAKDWAANTKRSQDLWQPLRDELIAVELNHDPPGHCSLCPR